MAADRWQINVVGQGERVRGQETLEALLLDFTTKLKNKGFIVDMAKFSYTGVTIVVDAAPVLG